MSDEDIGSALYRDCPWLNDDEPDHILTPRLVEIIRGGFDGTLSEADSTIVDLCDSHEALREQLRAATTPTMTDLMVTPESIEVDDIGILEAEIRRLRDERATWATKWEDTADENRRLRDDRDAWELKNAKNVGLYEAEIARLRDAIGEAFGFLDNAEMAGTMHLNARDRLRVEIAKEGQDGC